MEAQQKEDILRVSVFKNGDIEIDGKKMQVSEATATIATLAGTRKMIYYYREAGQDEPHPNAMKIIQAVGEARLPISLSTKPDFSDYVNEHGQSQPRK